MANAAKDVSVIIWDIGKSSTETAATCTTPNEKTFFEQSKECIEKILQRKIFSQPKDEVGLILVGSEATDNPLNVSFGDYENISIAFNLGLTNWQMLRTIELEIKPTNVEADWLDGIIVAMDFLKNQSEGMKIKCRKLILLSPFTATVNSDNFNVVVRGLQALEAELIVITNHVEYHKDLTEIGADVDDVDEEATFSQAVAKTQEQEKSESLITNILSHTDGVLCSFDQAMVQLIYFEKKHQRSMPWNCDFEIGNHLKIRISAYIYIKDCTSSTPWKTEGPNGPCRTLTEHFCNERKLDEEETENLIKGYMYGTTPVPYDASHGLSYKSGGKSLKCIGFTNVDQISEQYLTGSCVWAVCAQQKYGISEKLFITLVRVMRETNRAIVARYCYRAGLKPKIVILFPVPINVSKQNYRNVATLSMMELFYKDNHVNTPFPTLKSSKHQPTAEQYAAIDSLMDSMDLMNASDGGEAFAHKKILNPSIQYTYRTIAFRALHPNQPIPLPEQDLIDLLNPPKKLQEQAVAPLQSIKTLFPLEEIVKPTSSVKLFKKLQNISSVPEDQPVAAIIEEPDDRATLLEVGTVTPANDFLDLLRRGEKFTTLCAQIQNVIADLVLKSVKIPTEKVAMAIMSFREEAKLLGPFRYNEWIGEFKKVLLTRNKYQFWEEVIVPEQFGLISATESTQSTVTDAEADSFYAIDAVGTTVGGAAEDDDVDDDLFDNM